MVSHSINPLPGDPERTGRRTAEEKSDWIIVRRPRFRVDSVENVDKREYWCKLHDKTVSTVSYYLNHYAEWYEGEKWVYEAYKIEDRLQSTDPKVKETRGIP